MITVYNSMSRKKEPFKTIKPGVVNMYVCGPTVYSLSHIGHARSAVAFDVIFKYLTYAGFHVRYARNYTDVDDKIINKAKEEGKDSEQLALDNIVAFDEDMAALGVALPTYRPRATESIGIIITLIERLIEKGHAYAVDSDVYFSVRSFKVYGKLSGKNIDDLISGARVEVDERKKDPLDFALWKAAKPGEPSWPSPWGPDGKGKGRPGWHIECSAMSQCFLGETLDIHGGGKDLIFPHHENEIAQSEASTGKEFVRYWLHNGFVNIDKEKMSKSLGNILNIRDVLKEYSREVVRLFLLSSHYRSPIDYSRESLTESYAALERFYRTLKRMEGFELTNDVPEQAFNDRLAPVLASMDDDFNTAGAIGRIFEEVGEANRLMDSAKGKEVAPELSVLRAFFKEVSGFLGVFDRTAEEFFNEAKQSAGVDAKEVEGLIAERNKARDDKDFKRADEIRDALKAKGVILEDSAKGTSWTVG